MSNIIFDVAIVGAGPAGSTLAFQLTTSGIKTCLIDKETLPRKKTCAGGLPPKILDIIPFDIQSASKNEISNIAMTYGFKKAFSKDYQKKLIFTVEKEDFDYFLVQKAKERGVCLMEENTVKNISYNGEIYSILTDKQSVSSVVSHKQLVLSFFIFRERGFVQPG